MTTHNYYKPRHWVSLLLATMVFGASSLAGAQALWPEFPDAAQTPSITNHINPEHNDAVPLDAPVGIAKLWDALGSRSYFNPCSSGPEGNIYCSSYKGPGGECNLAAVDYKTGAELWNDGTTNGGECRFDIFTFPTTPLVDKDGNVYAGDSRIIASFTSEGELRWSQNYPADLQARTGKINTPFGMNILPTGEIITGTLGDGFILVMDSDTGNLLARPFDVPSEKVPGGGQVQVRPPWANNKFGCGDPNENLPPCGDAGAQAAWDSSFADTDNENDNDLSVDGQTGTIFMTGAAEGPNPGGDGKLWAMSYDASQPFDDRISIRFTVRFAGPGGSATTPGISEDGLYAVIGNNDQQALVTDIPMCLAAFGSEGTAANNYNECDQFSSIDIPVPLLASPTVTPDNILIVLGQRDGVLAFQLDGRGTGITGPEIWRYGAADMVPICASTVVPPSETLLPFPVPAPCPNPPTLPPQTAQTAVSVITAFDNVTYFGYTTTQILGLDANALLSGSLFPIFGPVTATVVAVDTQTGEEMSKTTFEDGIGELANVTMAADRRTLIINNFNFLSQVFWDRGLLGFNPNPPDPPLPSPPFPPPSAFTFALVQPKPFDQAAPGGINAWAPARPEEPVSGKQLKVLDALFPVLNFLSFTSRDSDIDLPEPGSALDPRRHGATLTLFNTETGEKQEIDLPAERWSYRAKLGAERYRYTDFHGGGPCHTVALADDKLIAFCSGQKLTFSLDEPSQGSLGVGFNISPSIVQCALFGGTVKADFGSEHGGFFSARNADASEECVIPD